MYLLLVLLSTLNTCARKALAANCTTADKGIWETGGGFFQAADKLHICSATTAGSEVQIDNCVGVHFAQYSERCQECFSEVITCTVQLCFDRCFLSIAGMKQEMCVLCVKQLCHPPFGTCAGFFLESCVGCVDPKPYSDVIPALAGTLGGVAGVGVAAIIYFVVQYKKHPNGDLAVEIVEIVQRQPQVYVEDDEDRSMLRPGSLISAARPQDNATELSSHVPP